MKFDCDLFVIGGGSGGVRAARVTASMGYKVCIAEGDRMGGTCVIRGCVPKKLMVYASRHSANFKEARKYGWDISVKDFNWIDFQRKLNVELDRLEKVYRKLLKNSDVKVFNEWAQISDAHTVTLASGKKITSKFILIATGGKPVRPDIINKNLGIVSDDVFGLKNLPKSLLIVGGGYIASEFAGIFNGLGSKVTQIYRGDQILRGFDNDARDLVSDTMVARGIKINTQTDLLRLDKKNNQIKATFSNESSGDFDQILFATGRKPNTNNLGLKKVNVSLGENSEVPVDKFSQTVVPSIFAIGDVTDRINLTPVAINEAVSFVKTIFSGDPTPVDHDLVPSAVFTQPELGSVGLAEQVASAREPIQVFMSKFTPMQRSFVSDDEKVLMKLIVSERTNVVIGCHIVAPDAAEMIQLASIAIKMKATKDQFDQICAVHPTMAEELITMKTPIDRG